MIKFLRILKYIGIGAGFLFATGIDYPPAPDGISWWNVWLAFICMGTGIVAMITQNKMVKRNKKYSRRKVWTQPGGDNVYDFRDYQRKRGESNGKAEAVQQHR